MMPSSSDHWLQRWPGALLAFLLCEGVGILASIATQSSVATWYPTLAKPAFTPPSWVFGPVWTLLYALMGIAVWLVGRRGWATRGVQRAIGLFAFQLGLNGLWSFAFFGFQSPSSGFIVIVLLWVTLAATTWQFFRLQRTAGWLLVPYLLWVTYAAALNGAIWWMN
jgi:tryptophan-rich sensory protein